MSSEPLLIGTRTCGGYAAVTWRPHRSEPLLSGTHTRGGYAAATTAVTEQGGYSGTRTDASEEPMSSGQLPSCW